MDTYPRAPENTKTHNCTQNAQKGRHETFRLRSHPCSNFSGDKIGLVITLLHQPIMPHTDS
eukprot:scaffold170065_cov75-Attheya_sp.AAC.1